MVSLSGTKKGLYLIIILIWVLKTLSHRKILKGANAGNLEEASRWWKHRKDMLKTSRSMERAGLSRVELGSRENFKQMELSSSITMGNLAKREMCVWIFFTGELFYYLKWFSFLSFHRRHPLRVYQNPLMYFAKSTAKPGDSQLLWASSGAELVFTFDFAAHRKYFFIPPFFMPLNTGWPLQYWETLHVGWG